MALRPHPLNRIRDYTPAELDWEYGTEYLKYSRPAFPHAFRDRSDFQDQYDAAPLRHLSDPEFYALRNSMACTGVGRGEQWIHDRFSHRRDTAKIIAGLSAGIIPPPIILKHRNGLHLMSGQTRLAAGAAVGLAVPAKVIEVME